MEGVEQIVLLVCSVAAEVVQLVLPQGKPCPPLCQDHLGSGTGSSPVEEQGGHPGIAQGPGGGGGGGVQVHQAGADIAGGLVAGEGGTNQGHLLRCERGVSYISGTRYMFGGNWEQAGKLKVCKNWEKNNHPFSPLVILIRGTAGTAGRQD